MASDQAFGDFELAGWEDETTAAEYDRHLSPGGGSSGCSGDGDGDAENLDRLSREPGLTVAFGEASH